MKHLLFFAKEAKHRLLLTELKKYQNNLSIINVISVDKGAYVDVMETISARLRLVVKDYSLQASDELIVRISADTFNTLKTKILAITFTVINEKNKCKAARGNYVLGLFKVSKENYEEVKKEIENVHSYSVPCIMKIDVSANKKYEDWIRKETKI